MPKILALKEGNIKYTCLEEDHNIWKKRRASPFQRITFSKLMSQSMPWLWEIFGWTTNPRVHVRTTATAMQLHLSHWGFTMTKDPKKKPNQKHKYSCSLVNNILMLEICKSLKSMSQTVISGIQDRGKFTKRCSVVCLIATSLSSLHV